MCAYCTVIIVPFSGLCQNEDDGEEFVITGIIWYNTCPTRVLKMRVRLHYIIINLTDIINYNKCKLQNSTLTAHDSPKLIRCIVVLIKYKNVYCKFEIYQRLY